MTNKDKRQLLLENGWGEHYRWGLWFDHSKDNLDVDESGVIVGFQPEEDGITFKEAFKQLTLILARQGGEIIL